jgi:ADP-ribose pyrophosphatase
MKLPRTGIRFLEIDHKREKPFFELEHWKCQVEYPDGSVSETFNYDIMRRNHPDAVVILAYHIDECEPVIYLRSCIRPALARRFVDSGSIWELPAGIIENEPWEDAAVRETEEELGFSVEASQFRMLGPPSFTCVGVTAEQAHFCHLKVNHDSRHEPKLDGSPLERHGVVAAVCLSRVKCMISSGQISDAKTEIAIRRFERLANLGSL